MEGDARTWTVISLGGSCIVPGEIDIDFLQRFKMLIEERVRAGMRFMIITGGGRTAREYQEALGKLGNTSKDGLDWVGVGAVRLNALLVAKMFGDLAHSEVVNIDPKDFSGTEKAIVVGGAWGVGTSTDYGSVNFAKRVGATRLVNLSNIDKVYTADPRTNPDAQPIDTITWAEFRKLIPSEWTPGLSSPFDPIAAKMAEAIGLEVAIMNGKNLDNLAEYLDGREFTGTVIS